MSTFGVSIFIRTEEFARAASGSIVGPIWIGLGDDYYPEAGWSDFPVVVLGWWLAALAGMSEHHSASTFRFMDGPFEFVASAAFADARLICSAVAQSNALAPISGSTTVDGLVSAVQAAARVAVAECDRRGWAGHDVEALRAQLRPVQ